MREKDKMLNGELYSPETDELLVNERINAKKLCQEYNNLPIKNLEDRKVLLKKILGACGQNYHIEPNFWCDYGYNISLGENFYSNHNLVILDPAEVLFGDNVFIGPNCGFYTAEHPINYKERNKGLEFAKPIKVGNNVWFGGNVTVIGGVTIGDNVTIGAGSVIVKDLPSNVLAVGNPCKVIKEI